jgi:hypothetical protein
MFIIINEMFSILSKIRGDQVSALASNTLCLSCGRGDVNFMPPIEVVRGNNGQYYRTDLLKKSPNSSRGPDFEYGKPSMIPGIDVFTKEEQTAEHTYHSHLPVDSIIQNNPDFPEGGETFRKKKSNNPSLFRKTGGITKPIKLRASGERINMLTRRSLSHQNQQRFIKRKSSR